jgi:hypothetical protein
MVSVPASPFAHRVVGGDIWLDYNDAPPAEVNSSALFPPRPVRAIAGSTPSELLAQSLLDQSTPSFASR